MRLVECINCGVHNSQSSLNIPDISNSKMDEAILTKDLSNWMSNLPDRLKLIPFIYLAIPGSHDSMTYSITSSSKIAPDADAWLKSLQFIGRPLRAIVARWSVTQSVDTTTQLENGIRYFDLRLATKSGTSEIFTCHGLYGAGVTQCFNEVNTFIAAHSGEVVILDLQHFYAFTKDDHEFLLNQISVMFGDKLLKFSFDVERFTLKYLTEENQYQVIVIYRTSDVQTPYWPSDYFPTPWPETTSIPQLFSILDYGLTNRRLNGGYVSQCVLTPDTEFVVRRLYSSLRNTCARNLQKPMMYWLKDQTPGKVGHLNVTIADFVEMNDWLYTTLVIRLNTKL